MTSVDAQQMCSAVGIDHQRGHADRQSGRCLASLDGYVRRRAAPATAAGRVNPSALLQGGYPHHVTKLRSWPMSRELAREN